MFQSSWIIWTLFVCTEDSTRRLSCPSAGTAPVCCQVLTSRLGRWMGYLLVETWPPNITQSVHSASLLVRAGNWAQIITPIHQSTISLSLRLPSSHQFAFICLTSSQTRLKPVSSMYFDLREATECTLSPVSALPQVEAASLTHVKLMWNISRVTQL